MFGGELEGREIDRADGWAVAEAASLLGACLSICLWSGFARFSLGKKSLHFLRIGEKTVRTDDFHDLLQ